MCSCHTHPTHLWEVPGDDLPRAVLFVVHWLRVLLGGWEGLLEAVADATSHEDVADYARSSSGVEAREGRGGGRGGRTGREEGRGGRKGKGKGRGIETEEVKWDGEKEGGIVLWRRRIKNLLKEDMLLNCILPDSLGLWAWSSIKLHFDLGSLPIRLLFIITLEREGGEKKRERKK